MAEAMLLADMRFKLRLGAIHRRWQRQLERDHMEIAIQCGRRVAAKGQAQDGLGAEGVAR